MAIINSINGNQSLKTTDNVAFNQVTAGSGTGLAKLTSGVIGTATAGTDYQAPLGFTAENVANKSTSVSTDGASDTKYPSVKAVKDYADSLIVGLTNLRGTYDASGNTYPTTGGSGTAGAILKGDYWVISTGGTLGGNAIQSGDWIIALVNTPGQTSSNWGTINGNLSYAPEDSANKSTTLDTDKTSDTKYPSVKSVYDWAIGLFVTLTGIQSITGLKTFDKDKIAMKGTSTGVTTISTENTSGTSYTATLPAKTGTIAMTSDIVSGITYNEVTGTTQALSAGTGYIMNNAGLVTGTLPGTCALGQVIEIVGKGAGLWKVAQNAGQTIHFGTSNSTAGIGGYISSLNTYDSVKLLCTTANTDFTVISSIGNISIV